MSTTTATTATATTTLLFALCLGLSATGAAANDNVTYPVVGEFVALNYTDAGLAATANYSTVLGGFANTAGGVASSVGGGGFNTASGQCVAVVVFCCSTLCSLPVSGMCYEISSIVIICDINCLFASLRVRICVRVSRYSVIVGGQSNDAPAE